MKAVEILPDGYKDIYSVDLQKNKKLAVLVNAMALLIAVLLFVPMNFYIPVSTMFDTSSGLGNYIKRFFVFMILLILYMVLHELVHGITMKIFGTKKVKYGFTGLYAFAGSDDYYCKKAYITISLAPVVLWGIVIAVINALVSVEWFWVVYFLQIINLSGASGDLYVTVKFSRLPKDILVNDCGVSMTVYSEF